MTMTPGPSRRLALRSALLLVLAVPRLSAQAACDTTRNPWAFLRQCFTSALPQGDTMSLARGLHSAVTTLRNPESLNPALAELAEVTHARRFIGSLNLNFINVQQGDDQGLALGYDWRRDLLRSPHKQGSPHGGVHSALEARGQIVPSNADNPEDFNSFGAHASLFYGAGGSATPSLMRSKLAGIADSVAAYANTETYLGSPSYLNLMAGLWDSLSTQYYFTGGVEARYESDQGGESTQWATGVRLGFDLKVWNPRRRGARLNVFDWPAALVRLATGTDSAFTPSGAAIPTLSILLHRVTPGSNAVRDSLLNLEPFNRLAFELRWRTKLSSVPQGPLWLTAEIRHHLEVAADPAISDAGQHRFSRVHLQVETPQGLTFSWAKGTLPFTQDDGDRWGVGFQLKYR
jgi:hypothetical protein